MAFDNPKLPYNRFIAANIKDIRAIDDETDKWIVGATLLAASGQYLFGDEANLIAPLPGYVTLGASTSYKLLPNLELFAWTENITNAQYYTLGTFSPISSVFIAQAPGTSLTQSYSPAAPIASSEVCVPSSRLGPIGFPSATIRPCALG